VALLTPYDTGYQQALVASLQQAGLEVVAERHAGLRDNLAFASAEPGAIAALARDALLACKPDALLVLCTNYPAAPVLPALEAETGVPMIDSTSVGVWAALSLAGIDTRPARAWGRVFDEAPLSA
jgi:maleate isomerase